VFCVGNEFFLVSLYLLSFWGAAETGQMIRAVMYITAPIFAGKQFMSVVQVRVRYWQSFKRHLFGSQLYVAIRTTVALDQREMSLAKKK